MLEFCDLVEGFEMRCLTFLLLLSLSPLLSAEIFVCVDPVTGEKSFTDKACGSHGTGDEVRIKKGNFGANGGTPEKNSGTKAWRSQDRSNINTSKDYTGARRNVEAAKDTGAVASRDSNS
ncbi:MAG: hypothetical protein ABJK20_09890 [Halieaceae bacterium]